MASFMAQRRDA